MKLKPCPFCGGSVFMWEDALQESPKIGRVIECERCGVRFVIPWALIADQAAEAWNRRNYESSNYGWL